MVDLIILNLIYRSGAGPNAQSAYPLGWVVTNALKADKGELFFAAEGGAEARDKKKRK
jgi:hypothetical protein